MEKNLLINIILDHVNEKYYYTHISEPGFKKDLINTIIELCEENGMLPPERPSQIEDAPEAIQTHLRNDESIKLWLETYQPTIRKWI
jgi:hypothetical protein